MVHSENACTKCGKEIWRGLPSWVVGHRMSRAETEVFEIPQRKSFLVLISLKYFALRRKCFFNYGEKQGVIEESVFKPNTSWKSLLEMKSEITAVFSFNSHLLCSLFPRKAHGSVESWSHVKMRLDLNIYSLQFLFSSEFQYSASISNNSMTLQLFGSMWVTCAIIEWFVSSLNR